MWVLWNSVLSCFVVMVLAASVFWSLPSCSFSFVVRVWKWLAWRLRTRKKRRSVRRSVWPVQHCYLSLLALHVRTCHWQNCVNCGTYCRLKYVFREQNWRRTNSPRSLPTDSKTLFENDVRDEYRESTSSYRPLASEDRRQYCCCIPNCSIVVFLASIIIVFVADCCP